MNWLQTHGGWLSFLGLTAVWPALVYLAIFHTLDVDLYIGHADAAVGLAVTGLAAWVVLRIRAR